MKTLKTLLSKLPENIKEKALKNTPKECYGMKRESISEALQCSFVWTVSPEGHDYWAKIQSFYYELEEM